jgi:hypothetical protein
MRTAAVTWPSSAPWRPMREAGCPRWAGVPLSLLAEFAFPIARLPEYRPTVLFCTTRARSCRYRAAMETREVPASLAPFLPSDDWIEAFEAQFTKELLKKAKRFAERRARWVGHVGGVVDDYYVRELVEDVLGDTSVGVLRWDPSVERLEEHVMDAIKSRSSHDIAHAKRFPRESIDAFDPDASHATMAAVDAVLLLRREASRDTAALAETALVELRELAAEDRVVLQLLDAFATGATTKADVMLLTGMSDKTYHAARVRLDRLVARLSPHAQPSRRVLAKGA